MPPEPAGPYWIDDLPADAGFPAVDQATLEPNGLLAIGGDLHPRRLLSAYRSGIFPWFSAGQPILWWSPDPRMVLVPTDLRLRRSLRQRLRRRDYAVRFDTDFAAVITACAEIPARQQGTWITPGMAAAYRGLHRLGHAHSVEVWIDGQLVGGLYGVAVGRTFCGESMFSLVRDASKLALAHLCRHAIGWGIELIDCQVHSPHLAGLGAVEIPRAGFIERLQGGLNGAPAPGPWEAVADWVEDLQHSGRLPVPSPGRTP